MNKREARVYVRDHHEVVFAFQDKPNTVVEIRCVYDGWYITGRGWARYNHHDEKAGLPWIPQIGVDKATGRAIKDAAAKLLKLAACEKKPVQHVTVTRISTQTPTDTKAQLVYVNRYGEEAPL